MNFMSFIMSNVFSIVSAELEILAKYTQPPSQMPLAVFTVMACMESLNTIDTVVSRHQEVARRRAPRDKVSKTL